MAAARTSKEEVDSFAAEHVEIIRFTRGYFLQYSKAPLLSATYRITPQARRCMHERFMTFLERAWNIAGLSQRDSAYFLGQRDEHQPKQPAAVKEQTQKHV